MKHARILTYVIVTAFFQSTAVFAASLWTMKDEYVPGPRPDVRVSRLTFAKDERRVQFTPQKVPYGYVAGHAKKLGERDFFVTIWAYGANTVMLRVFDPEKSNQPICEMVSYLGKSDLRLSAKKVQVLALDRDEDKPRWKDCR